LHRESLKLSESFNNAKRTSVRARAPSFMNHDYEDKVRESQEEPNIKVSMVSKSKRRLSFAESSLILDEPQTSNVNNFDKRRSSIRVDDVSAMKNSSYIAADQKIVTSYSAIPETPEMGLHRKTSESSFIEKPMGLSRRITQGREDLKMASIIIEKDQEMSLVQKRCQLYEDRNKQLEA
jgi:hypothetical protein